MNLSFLESSASSNSNLIRTIVRQLFFWDFHCCLHTSIVLPSMFMSNLQICRSIIMLSGDCDPYCGDVISVGMGGMTPYMKKNGDVLLNH